MRKKQLAESQIAEVLKQVEEGRPIKEVCEEIGVSEATLYAWRTRYGEIKASDLQRLREIEIELAKLKRMYAELALENHALRSLIAKREAD